MRLLKYLALFVSVFIMISCSSQDSRPWKEAIPHKVPFVIIPDEEATVTSMLNSAYAPFIDDITASAIPLLSKLDSSAASPINLEGVMLYPGARNELETIWVTKTESAFLNTLKQQYFEDFSQNQYSFLEKTINKFELEGRNIFAAKLHDVSLFSESSLGIEDAIRSYKEELPRAELSDMSFKSGHIILNTPSLDQWIQQLSQVQYHPKLKKLLEGLGPTQLSVTQQGEQQNREIQLQGSIPVTDNESSTIVAAVTGENRPISLDRYISSNAAAFSLFRLQPRMAPPTSLTDTTGLDSLLMASSSLYANIAKTLDKEFAMVTYAESGFLSTGEHLFLRKLANPSQLQKQLKQLANKNLIQIRDGSYFIQSAALSELIGSSLSSFQDFYLELTEDAVVISRRKGLVELVVSDYNRRRTVYYEPQFREIKNSIPSSVSSLTVISRGFQSFITPFLIPENYMNDITSRFDFLTMATRLDEDQQELSFQLQTIQAQEQNNPYEENWLFPTDSELSGPPVTADIGGSARDEVIFATKSGQVYALAADGTVVMEATTGTDEPKGSPVVYDWYGTNENVVLLAAGNKIYGWDDNAQPLPKFPFRLEEAATSPVIVSDINRNGIPDALVATADRKLHALNGRGQNLNGWPTTTNAAINTAPVVSNFRNALTVLAFSENTVHAWNGAGVPLKNYPKFLNAPLNGSPVTYEDQILGNAADGNVYSIGPSPLFADTVNVLETPSDSSNVEAVYVSNSSLVGSPSVQELTVSTNGQSFKEPMILTMSANGSVFLLNTKGQLRFNKNMGQPADAAFTPYITDINQDGQQDIIALADYGRLYVWQVNTGERFFSDAIPANGMNYPVVIDIDNNGYNELIANTSEGVRCWTIYGN